MATALKDSFETPAARNNHPEAVVVRFAGDSGDGMQLTGNQFTNNTALLGIDLATFPDFPAEIRAPIFEEKVVDHLLGQVKVSDKSVSREALFADDEEEATAEAKPKAAKAKKTKKAATEAADEASA